jgi:hypothetical protein
MCARGSQERPSGEGDYLVEARDRRHHVGVGQLHALGRPCRTRGVDERQRVVGIHGLPGGIEVEVRAGMGLDLPVVVHHDRMVDALQVPKTIDEGLLGHEDARLGVPKLVLDLFGGIGVVDRERRGPEMKGRGIEPMELGPVREHDAHGAAALESEAGQPGRRAPDLVGVLRPAH